MNNRTIFKTAYYLTINNPKLWLLGLFLSSGFSLHFWYGLDYLQRNITVIQLLNYLYSLSKINLIILVILCGIGGLLFFNYVKILFLKFCHNLLHDQKTMVCMICERQEEKQVPQVQWVKVLPRVIWASIITVSLSIVSVGSFKLLIGYGSAASFGLALNFICLFGVIGLISLWNCFFVLFALWYKMDFGKSSILAMDLLFSKIKKIAVAMILATLIFLGSVALGGTLILQIQQFLLHGFPLLIPGFETAWNSVVVITSGIIFFVWLILNNVWFNMVIIILFDSLVKSKSTTDQFLVKQVEPI